MTLPALKLAESAHPYYNVTYASYVSPVAYTHPTHAADTRYNLITLTNSGLMIMRTVE